MATLKLMDFTVWTSRNSEHFVCNFDKVHASQLIIQLERPMCMLITIRNLTLRFIFVNVVEL